MKTNKNLTGTSLVGSSVNRERVEKDFYATPKESTEALLNNFDLSNCESFYEPACGDGAISKILLNRFKDALVRSTDLVNRGYGRGEVDFLKISNADKFDCIITNPPFKLIKEFIEKALTLSNKYIIMFAKIQLLEGLDRYKLFQKNPPKYVYVFSNRQNPLRNGNSLDEKGKKWCSTMCFAWFIWELGNTNEPVIRWLKTK